MSQDLYQPLNLLTQLCKQLEKQEIAFTGNALQDVFQQIQQSVVGVLDFANVELDRASTEWQKTADALDPQDQAAFQHLQGDFELSKTEMQECLEMAKSTFLAADNIQEFQHRAGFLTLVKARMDNSLRKIDSTLMMSKHPEQVSQRPQPLTSEVQNALKRTGEALQHINSYMASGSMDSIDLAVAALDKAKDPLQRILLSRRLSHFSEL
jgi:hypothetical protein